MQGNSASAYKGLEEIFYQICIKILYLAFFGKNDLVNQIWPLAYIKRYRCNGFIHWHSYITIPFNAFFISQCLFQRIPHTYPNIFNHVMVVYLNITFCL